MDQAKCAALKRELSGMDEPQVVPLERFFDGNDDAASIGCNLGARHPGMPAFHDTLAGLQQRPGVLGVYAQIFEADPGEEYWPSCDTILVVGAIPANTLRAALRPLHPDEVNALDAEDVPAEVAARHPGAPVLSAWWE